MQLALGKIDIFTASYGMQPLIAVEEKVLQPYHHFYFVFRYAGDTYDDTLEWVFVTREPTIIPRFYQQFMVFSHWIWLSVFGVLLIMVVAFKITHYLYQTKIGIGHNLAGRVTHPLDFIILTFSTLTEPDPLPWFPKQSTGYNTVIK